MYPKLTRSMPTIRVTTALIMVVAAPSCTKDLIFATHTTLGVEVKGKDGIPTSVMLAYERYEGAIIPVQPGDENASAHSVLGSINATQKPFAVSVKQVFATGEAADIAAKTEKNAADDGKRGPLSNALDAAAAEIGTRTEGSSDNG